MEQNDDMKEIRVISVNNLVQVISRQVVLDDVNLEVAKNECLGIYGSRGSGKTSLLHIMAGIDRYKSGRVEILGCNVRKDQSFKKHTGLLTQKQSLFRDLRTAENFELIAALKDASRQDIERVIDDFELKPYLKEPITMLEGGIYQRVSLACAMLNSPQLLILDEVIKDIDLYSRHLIVKCLKTFKNQGGTLVCGFSNIEFCKYMDRVGWLENKQLSIMTPEEARDKYNNLDRSMADRLGNTHA